MPTPRDARTVYPDITPMTENLDNDGLVARYLEYQTHVARRRWRAETVRVRTLQLRVVCEELAPTSLLAATEDDLVGWYARLRGTPETVASYASAVRGLYRWMAVTARPRLRTDDPAMVLERPRIPETQPRPMLDRHYDLALACSLADPQMYLWLGLMGCSGLRCCEVAWLTVGDVERREVGALLHLTGKGGKQRTVPVGEMLALTLTPFVHGRGPVFTRPSDGAAHTAGAVSRRVAGFLDGLGVPPPNRAHALRHRFGTDYHGIDADLYRQAKIMGHASVDTTQRYTEIHPVEAARYIEQLTHRRLYRRAG